MVGATVCSSAVLAVGTPVGERLLSSIDVVDIEGVVRAFDPSFFDQDEPEGDEPPQFDESMTMW